MKIKCPACEAVLKIPPSAAGKVVKCPCGKQLRAPAVVEGTDSVPASGPAPGPSPTGDTASEQGPSGLGGTGLGGTGLGGTGLGPSGLGGTESNAFDDLPDVASTTAANPFTQNSPYSPPASASAGNPVGVPQANPPGNSGQTHPVAIVSLVFGILSLTIGCCCWLHVPLSLTAIVTGGFGIHFANQGHGGKGMAIAGLILGIIALVLYTILAIIGVAAQFANMPNGPFNQ